MNCPQCNVTLAARWTRCGMCGHRREKAERTDARLIRSLLEISKASVLRLPGYDKIIAEAEAYIARAVDET